MLSTQMNLKSGSCFLSLALLGGITLSGAVSPVETTHASAAQLPEQSWLTFAGPWLCRVWTGTANSVTLTAEGSTMGSGVTVTDAGGTPPIPLAWVGSKPPQAGTANVSGDSEALVSTATTVGATFGDTTVHCTRKWYVNSLGYIISETPNWVADPTGAWPETTAVPDWLAHSQQQVDLMRLVDAPRPKPKPKPRTPSYRALSYSPPAYSPPTSAPPRPSGPYSPWEPVPGHPSYSMGDFAGDPYSAYFGYCTWYAWYRNQGEPLMRLGNADAWAANAPRFGLRTGTTPVVGATAVFAPGVEGAGGAGHVGHVEAVLGGGWFIVSEMNFGWNGGGFGRVDWRFVYVTSGVTFIY